MGYGVLSFGLKYITMSRIVPQQAIQLVARSLGLPTYAGISVVLLSLACVFRTEF